MSELHAQSRSRGVSLFWPAYMSSWALLAGAALTYLSLSSLQTIGSPGSLPKPSQSTPESNRAELDRAQLTARIQSLNDTVASLRTEVVRLKTERATPSGGAVMASRSPTEALSSEPQATPSGATSDITTSSISKPDKPPLKIASDGEMARLTENKTPSETEAAVETAALSEPKQPQLLNPTTSSSAENTKPARAEAPAVVEPKPRRVRNLATSLLRPGRVPPLPPYNAASASPAPNPKSTRNSPQVTSRLPTILNTAADAVQTASRPVPTSLKPQPPAAVKPPPTRPLAFGTPTVQRRQASVSPAALSLSTAQSVTGLRASWLLLTTRHPATFGGYQPRYVADQASGTYRLLAGPIANHAEADRICNQLRAQSVSCGVTSYIGSSLQ